MTILTVLAPLFVQVALTFVLIYWLGTYRLGHVRRGEVKVRDIALGERNWPVRATQVANAFHNQFELPLLFYVLVVLAILTRKADLLFVVLSWVFVLSRIVHAYIHVTSNRVGRRFLAYNVGLITLVIMWIMFALRILLSD